MTTGLTIRPATMDDCAAIRGLLDELDSHHVRLLPEVFQPFDDPTRQRDRIARFLEEDDAELFVAEFHTDLVGLVTVRISENPDVPMFRLDRRACIDDLVVRHESRAQGIGKLLLARVMEWTRSRKLQYIDINVWNENKVGRSFFESNGFEPRYQRMEFKIDKAGRSNALTPMDEQIQQLIDVARPLLGEMTLGRDDMTAATVAAAIRSRTGRIYTGVCIHVTCGIGFCAEHAAVAEMIKGRETEIEMIVAVADDCILSPCGRCRELLVQVNPTNRNAIVVLDGGRVVKLSELLPEHWLG